MAGGRVYPSNSSTTAGGSNNLSVLLQSQRVPSSSSDPLFIPGSSTSFLGTFSHLFSLWDSLEILNLIENRERPN